MTQSQMTRILNWVALSIALLVCVTVLQHVYNRHFVTPSSQHPYSFNDLPALDAPPVTANISKIANKHIFGAVPKQAVIAEPTQALAPVDAPVTPLNIKLTGIVLGETPEKGMAMFEVERGRTLVVAVSEEIGKTSAKLNQVLPGEALINRNGSIESVKMVRNSLSIAKLDKESMASLPQPYIEKEQDEASEPQYDATLPEPPPSEDPEAGRQGLKKTKIKISSPLERGLN